MGTRLNKLCVKTCEWVLNYFELGTDVVVPKLAGTETLAR